MELIKKLPLFALMLLLASCNEKVNPELNGSSVTSGGGGLPTVVPETYYMKVEATSPVMLNYQLHRTGNGNYNTECKISSDGVALSNDLYTAEAIAATDHDDKQFDISCFYDAEELAIYMNGIDFKLTASANTCAYIGYAPYSFYDRIPGDSSSTYTQVTCDASIDYADSQAYLQSVAYTGSPDTVPVTSLTGTMGCTDYIDTDYTAGLPAKRQNIISDSDLCSFDYSDETPVIGQDQGKNCDIGEIVVNTVAISSSGHTVTQREINCGGLVRNCIKGPINLETELDDVTKGTVIYDTVLDADFTKEWDLPKLVTDRRATTTEYTNYRRNLANKDIDFINTSDNTYKTIWATDPSREQFDPNLMEYYSNNRRYESATPIISTANWATEGNVNGYRAFPLAGDPFLGISHTINTKTIANSGAGLVSYRTNPFYTFYCLDNALEVKGKIRMVIRDWDRIFTADANLEAISDYVDISPTRNTISKQDNGIDQEVPGYPGVFSNFNDFTDWDDLIPMERTAGAYAAGATVWYPYITGSYPNGFFNPSYFTNGFL